MMCARTTPKRPSCWVIAQKASAALSRRCLQHILREAAGVKPRNLADEIEQTIQAGIPGCLSEALDAVRVIGNLAAHPTKSQQTGSVLAVEPQEAEWSLDTLD